MYIYIYIYKVVGEKKNYIHTTVCFMGLVAPIIRCFIGTSCRSYITIKTEQYIKEHIS